MKGKVKKMNSGEAKKKKHIGLVISLVFLSILIIGIVILIINLFHEKTAYTSIDKKNAQTVYLSCKTKSKDIPDAFFDVSDAISATQIVKVIFKDKTINNVAYAATIEYVDDTTAIRKEAELSVKHGRYVQTNDANINIFSPNFSADGTEVKISLFANADQLSPAFLKIFLIDGENTVLSSYTPEALATYFENKGFKCEINK